MTKGVRVRRAPQLTAVSVVLAGLLLGGCATGRVLDTADTAASSTSPSGGSSGAASTGTRPGRPPGGGATSGGSAVTVADPEHAVPPPGPRRARLLPDDMLIFSREPISPEMSRAVRRLPGIDATMTMSMAQVALEDQVVNVAAVDPGEYRRFTVREVADRRDVWARVAGGEVAITEELGQEHSDADGYVKLGNDRDAPRVHVGALSPQVEQVDAVVNEKWGAELGMIEGNAMLVSTGIAAPERIRPRIQRIVGRTASILFLAPELDITAQQTAFLTGGSVAQAVGTFNYRVIGGGRIAPDPSWVAANIRTEPVPILGNVTCHRAMLPQFRAALTEIVTRGLADKIHPGEYAGCHYPRFIAGTTSLSLHSFGIAVDLNVPGNQRGTVGEIDRDVVAIFKKWGFAWGGDWSWTDPMHFEMNAVVEPR